MHTEVKEAFNKIEKRTSPKCITDLPFAPVEQFSPGRYRMLGVKGEYRVQIPERDLYWLAGIFEGEGYFSWNGSTVRVGITMTDQDVVERVAKILNRSEKIKHKQIEEFKPIFILEFTGIEGCSLMLRLYGLLSERRQGQIAAVLDRVNVNTLRLKGKHNYSVGGIARWEWGGSFMATAN